MDFHAKSVAQKWLSYEYFVLFYVCTLFGQSIQTSMQNLESLAQKMS